MDYLCISHVMNISIRSLICHLNRCKKKYAHLCILCACVCADGSMLCVRAYTQRMKWNKLLMKALRAHPAPHMFRSLWVSHETNQFHVRLFVCFLIQTQTKVIAGYSYLRYKFLFFHATVIYLTFHSRGVGYYGLNKDQRAR